MATFPQLAPLCCRLALVRAREVLAALGLLDYHGLLEDPGFRAAAAKALVAVEMKIRLKKLTIHAGRFDPKHYNLGISIYPVRDARWSSDEGTWLTFAFAIWEFSLVFRK